MAILLTGAGGYIGRHLLQRLPEDTVPVYRVPGDDGVGVDLANHGQVRWLAEWSPPVDTVIHLAGKVDIRLRTNPKNPLDPPVPGDADPEPMYEANVIGTLNMLDFCLIKKVRHFIFISSQAVYGMPNGPLTEESPLAPLEPYATTKMLAEYATETGVKMGLHVTVLRIPGVYSEDRPKGLVHRMCQQALHDQSIQVRVPYPLPLDVIHLDDVLAGIEAAALHGGDGFQVVNIATGEPCNANLLAHQIAELVPGCSVETTDIPQPLVIMDPTKAHRLYRWRAVPRAARLAQMLTNLGG